MKKIKIRKGHHYPFPFIPLPFPKKVKKKGYTFKSAFYKFTSSCMFDLHDEDQWDVNKLFGFSVGNHHKGSSFRFGWRPKLATNNIEIVAYEYHDGIRQKTIPICKVELNDWNYFDIAYNSELNKIHYTVAFHELIRDINLKKKWGWGYILGTYFGGNEKAPHTIIIYKEKTIN